MPYLAPSLHGEFSILKLSVKRAPDMSSLFYLETLYPQCIIVSFSGLGAMLFANLIVIATIFVMGYQSMLAEKNRNRPKARVYDI